MTKGVTDEGWNTYVKTLEDLRIAEFVQIYQTAYERYLAANQ